MENFLSGQKQKTVLRGRYDVLRQQMRHMEHNDPKLDVLNREKSLLNECMDLPYPHMYLLSLSKRTSAMPDDFQYKRAVIAEALLKRLVKKSLFSSLFTRRDTRAKRFH